MTLLLLRKILFAFLLKLKLFKCISSCIIFSLNGIILGVFEFNIWAIFLTPNFFGKLFISLFPVLTWIGLLSMLLDLTPGLLSLLFFIKIFLKPLLG